MTTQSLPWYCREVNGQYGSPTGRTSYGAIAGADTGSLTVVKLPMDLVDRTYDIGGAYWGYIPGSYIWCCFDHADGDDGVCRYVRATSERQAIGLFGIKPEQIKAHPSLHPPAKPVLFLDVCGAGCEVDVTALIKAFANEDDHNSLMMSPQDFCLCGSDSTYSWTYAQEQVEGWAFTDTLYRQAEARFRSSGIEGELSRLDLRAMLLQEVAAEYVEWFRLGSDSATFGEYLNREDGSGRIYYSEEGKYYLSIDD